MLLELTKSHHIERIVESEHTETSALRSELTKSQSIIEELSVTITELSSTNTELSATNKRLAENQHADISALRSELAGIRLELAKSQSINEELSAKLLDILRDTSQRDHSVSKA